MGGSCGSAPCSEVLWSRRSAPVTGRDLDPVRLRPTSFLADRQDTPPTARWFVVCPGVVRAVVAVVGGVAAGAVFRQPRGARIDPAVHIRRGLLPSSGEAHSWESSLHFFVGDLRDAGLEDLEVLVEHRLPLSSKRTDVIGVRAASAHRRRELAGRRVHR